MIVLGVDPGARSTGFALIDTDGVIGGIPRLLRWAVLDRPKGPEPVESVPRGYVVDVCAAIADTIRTEGVELLAAEGVTKPRGHAAGRRGHLIDPAGLIGTATVLGAIAGRLWTIPLVVVPPGQNGTHLPLNRYPHPIGTTGKGNDRKRHARSAYDVAHQARNLHLFEKGQNR